MREIFTIWCAMLGLTLFATIFIKGYYTLSKDTAAEFLARIDKMFHLVFKIAIITALFGLIYFLKELFLFDNLSIDLKDHKDLSNSILWIDLLKFSLKISVLIVIIWGIIRVSLSEE